MEYRHRPSQRLVPRRDSGPIDHASIFDESVAPAPVIPPPPPLKPTIEERFLTFHAQHPEVYDEIVRLAREAKDAGRTKIGLKACFEVARWNLFLADVDDNFKLNNIFTSRYARLIQEQEPDLAGLFETRKLVSQ